jgi:hypothetical protein
MLGSFWIMAIDFSWLVPSKIGFVLTELCWYTFFLICPRDPETCWTDFERAKSSRTDLHGTIADKGVHGVVDMHAMYDRYRCWNTGCVIAVCIDLYSGLTSVWTAIEIPAPVSSIIKPLGELPRTWALTLLSAGLRLQFMRSFLMSISSLSLFLGFLEKQQKQ